MEERANNDHSLIQCLQTDLKWMREAQDILLKKIDNLYLRLDVQAALIARLREEQMIGRTKQAAIIAVLVIAMNLMFMLGKAWIENQ